MKAKKNEQDHNVKYWWIFPYRWKPKKILADIWNKKEPRIFPPKQFGIGWGLNLHALLKKIKRK